MLVFRKTRFNNLKNQGKLKTFKKFKTNLDFEEYLNEISNIEHSQAVTKLLCGCYTNIPFDERTCKQSQLNEVGTWE